MKNEIENILYSRLQEAFRRDNGNILENQM